MNLEQQRLGDYVLAERLAEDTTGTLYRAVHATQKTEVAVKVLHAKYRNDPALVARFKQAAKNLGGVNHPGIAQVLDHGESASGLFLVMEKLVGETLAARLKRERRLSLKETQEIVGAVASALAAAHRQRIVHRKLDADSVFLVGGDAGTAVKILGLGLAKLLGHKESGSGKDVDQRADILALGSLSYEMLSGQAPVPVSVQPSERQPGGQRPKAARLSTLDVTVPSAVEAAIMKALEGKKKRRFSSMAEFARAFGAPFALPAAPAPKPAAVTEPSTEAAPRPTPTPVPPAPPRPERSTTLTGVMAPLQELGRKAKPRQIATVVGAVAAAALVILWFGFRSDEPRDAVTTEVKPPPAKREADPELQPPPARPAPPPSAPSRVDEILALNHKAVSAYARADIKTAKGLLEKADQLAVASGYEKALVRAQTQVRLGALWISSKKNPRIGRRYLASAVAINPAVKLPSEMTTPKVRKALHQVRAKAQPAGARGQKGSLAAKAKRRHGREGARPRTASTPSRAR